MDNRINFVSRVLLAVLALGVLSVVVGCDEETVAPPEIRAAADAQRRAMQPKAGGGVPANVPGTPGSSK